MRFRIEVGGGGGVLCVYWFNLEFMFKRTYNSNVFWNHTWWSAQQRALCIEISKVNLSAFIYRLFHEDFSAIIGTNTGFSNLCVSKFIKVKLFLC